MVFKTIAPEQLSEIIQRERFIKGTIMFFYSSSCRREPVPRPQPKPGSFLLSLVPIKQDQTVCFFYSSRWSFGCELTGDSRLNERFLQGSGASVLYADECIFQDSICPLFAIPSSSVFHLKTTCNPCVRWLSILRYLQSSGGSKATFINSV